MIHSHCAHTSSQTVSLRGHVCTLKRARGSVSLFTASHGVLESVLLRVSPLSGPQGERRLLRHQSALSWKVSVLVLVRFQIYVRTSVPRGPCLLWPRSPAPPMTRSLWDSLSAPQSFEGWPSVVGGPTWLKLSVLFLWAGRCTGRCSLPKCPIGQ